MYISTTNKVVEIMEAAYHNKSIEDMIKTRNYHEK
jgi:hypothetical protein